MAIPCGYRADPGVRAGAGAGRAGVHGVAASGGFCRQSLRHARGRVILAECKLWRNPEARREVVAQIPDYAESAPRRSLMLKWSASSEHDLNLDYVMPHGLVRTDNCINTTAKPLDVTDLCQAYREELAAAIGGEVVTRAGAHARPSRTAPRGASPICSGYPTRGARPSRALRPTCAIC